MEPLIHTKVYIVFKSTCGEGWLILVNWSGYWLNKDGKQTICIMDRYKTFREAVQILKKYYCVKKDVPQKQNKRIKIYILKSKL